MYRLGAMISAKVDVVQLATAPLHRIVAYSNESCALALYRDEDATLVFSATVESPQQLRCQLDLYHCQLCRDHRFFLRFGWCLPKNAVFGWNMRKSDGRQAAPPLYLSHIFPVPRRR